MGSAGFHGSTRLTAKDSMIKPLYSTGASQNRPVE